MKFDSLLMEQPMMTKIAVVESPNGQQLEQDFGKLAYAFLKDRAPKLLSYLIGFEIVDANPDGSRAVGIFGFKIGEGIYYVPVFFLNNQIKGMDLLYSRDTDSFVPLKETWVNYVVTRQTVELGEAADPNVRESFTTPDFSGLAYPPQLGVGGRDSGSIKASQAAAAKPSPIVAGAKGFVQGGKRDITTEGKINGVQQPVPLAGQNAQAAQSFIQPPPPPPVKMGAADIMKDISAHFMKMAASTIDMLASDKEFQSMFTGLIAAYKGGEITKTSADNSALVRFIKMAGGPECAKTLARALQNPEFAKAACTFYDYRDLLINEFDENLKPKVAASKVTVVTKDNDHCVPEGCDSDTASKVIRNGFAIKDLRDDKDKTEVFDYKTDDQIYNPTEPGKYDVLTMGGITEATILTPSIPALNKRMMVMISKDGKPWTTAHGRRVFVNGDKTSPEAKTEIFNKGKAPSSMEVDKTYVLVDEKLDSTVPFRVSSVARAGDEVQFQIDYQDSIQHDADNDNDSIGLRGYGECCSPRTYDVTLRLSPSKGKARGTSQSLLIPEESYKAIELGSYDNYQERNAMKAAFRPASYAEVCESLYKESAHNLKVETRDEGIAYTLWLDGVNDKQDLNYKSACIRLVLGYGMSVDHAEDMLKQASREQASKRLIKFAQIRNQVVGPTIPQYQPNGYDATLGIPVQNDQVNYTQGETNVPPPQPSGPGSNVNVGGEAQRQQMGTSGGSNTSPGNMMPDAGTLAQMAADSGQQQVFDHASIGGMSRIYDTNEIIDSFIPDFMKTLDKVGRLLFLLYWKNEDWAERFGTQDMGDMEDMIKSVFKNFGDMSLKLKQKATDQSDRFYI